MLFGAQVCPDGGVHNILNATVPSDVSFANSIFGGSNSIFDEGEQCRSCFK